MNDREGRIRKPSNIKPGYGITIEPGAPGPIEVIVDPVIGKGQAVQVSVRAPGGTWIKRFRDLSVPQCPVDNDPLRQLKRTAATVWVCRTCHREWPVEEADRRV